MRTFVTRLHPSRVHVLRVGRRRGACAALFACVGLLGGCDDPPSPPPERAPEPEIVAESYRVVEVDDGGSVGGTVRWRGPRPEPVELEVRVHEQACGATQPSSALRVTDRDRVALAVVSLVGVEAGRALEDDPVALTQRGCRFDPHVLTVGVGQPIVLANEDSILHNVTGRVGRQIVLDVGLPERGASVTRTIDAPGAVQIGCDVGHTWQRAWIHAFDHPYHAVTDERGRFRIGGVPPGRYALRLWHQGWRVTGTDSGRPTYSEPVILIRSVSVSARQETRVDFELSQQAAEIAGG